MNHRKGFVMYIDPICGMEVTTETCSLVKNGRLYHFCSEGCLEEFKSGKDRSIQPRGYDLVIVGGGPAGLTAAVYAAIQHVDTFLITKDVGGQAVDSTKIKNYMGFDFITGPELTEKFQHQLLHSHYIDHRVEEIIEIKKQQNGFSLHTVNGEVYFTRTCILATGMQRRKLGIPGEETFQRKGIFYRSVQDKSLVQDIPVTVIGGGNSGIQAALEFEPIASRVTLVTDEITADANIQEELYSSTIKDYSNHVVVSIEGREKVEGVVIKHRSGHESFKLETGAVLIAVGFKPNSMLISGLAERNEKSEIIVTKTGETSLPGLFAAGDVTDITEKRIIIASGDGAKAALAARKYLNQIKGSG